MSIRHILLGILSWQPSSGYLIKSEVEFKGRNLGWGPVSYGSIYPKLKELQQEGLISTYHQETSGRKTKFYELTAAGWRELSRWLAIPPAEPVTRDELFIKLSFWGTGRPEDRETLIEHLQLREAESREMLKHFEEWGKNNVSAIDGFGVLSRNHMIARLELELRWIRQTTQELKHSALPPLQDPNRLFAKARKRRQRALEEDGDPSTDD